MNDRFIGAQGFRFFEYSAKVSAVLLFAIFIASVGRAQTTDQTPPSAPTGLIASAASCGQVDLSWGASTDNVGGSGLRAYTIYRNDGVNTAIGSARTTFSDTNWVRSSTTLSYYVVAQDSAGNNSAQSNTISVVTPSCSLSAGENVVDSAYVQPLGKSMATYGNRSVLIYQKLNMYSTRDTWLYVKDSDTGQTSHFLLHSSPGYLQMETDYVLMSSTELWTLSCDLSSGKLLVSQYQLNGSTPTSATLLSTKSLGDNYSYGMSMIRLQSGALVVGWSDQAAAYTGDLIAGYAYRSPGGTWIIRTPVTLASAGGVNQGWKTRLIMAQHPADSSVWMFVKEDTSSAIEALHFTEAANDFVADWTNPNFITQATDGDNGPEGEFPYLSAVADPTRNAILLAYQSRPYQFVFIDPLYTIMNSILLKQSYATVAQVATDASKTFIPFQTYMERATQFGMSVLPDGTIWLAYLPINSQTLTWNEVFASKYQSGAWSTPALVGFNYNNYNQSSGLGYNPGALVYRNDQPLVAFVTPDQKVHTVDLSSLGTASTDSTPPTTSITSPTSGATVSGTLAVSASASDNVGVTGVELLVDGTVSATLTAAPYNFTWNTSALANGSHALQTQAHDAAGNVGLSAAVSVTVNNTTSQPPPSLAVGVSIAGTTFMPPGSVPISAAVLSSGQPASGVGVTFTLTTPNGSKITQSATTGSNGVANWSYKVNSRSPVGTYSVVAQATLGTGGSGGKKTIAAASTAAIASNAATFSVQ